MPGLLKSSAKCPVCGVALIALIDTTNAKTVTREYFHNKGRNELIRKRRCVRVFTDYRAAANERSGIEVHCALPNTGQHGQYRPN